MNKIKEYVYDKNTSWQGYMDFIKGNLKRLLTTEEYKSMMRDYINGVSPENCLKKMKSEK